MVRLSKLRDFFLLALDNLSHRRTRAFLTMLGIFIGVAAVVSLVALGQGLSDSVNAEFRKIGTDKLIVLPGSSMMGAAFMPKLLSDSDLSAAERVHGVAKAGYAVFHSALVRNGNKAVFAQIIGIPTSPEHSGIVEEFLSVEVTQGRSLDSNDRQKALVGSQFATKDVFPRGLKSGDTIQLNGTDFRVVGVLKRTGNPTVDGGIIIPADDAVSLFSLGGYNRIILRLSSGTVPSDLVEPVTKALRRSRGVQKDKEDFTVQTSEQLLSSFNAIFGIIQAIVIGIAAISLVVGAIGIMNTMYTAVLERTNEIGVMKAIGAKNEEILTIFLIESGLLGLVGGAIGVILGFLMAKGAEVVANQALGTDLITAYFPPELVAGALLFSFIVGSVSGVFPAREAAMLAPVDALRYE